MNARYNLNRLAYYVAVVEERTITAAAERLGLSKAVVSKHLQLLEQEVGVSLLVRNTRHMQPTEAGQEFYEGSKATLIQADETFESVLERGRVPTGRLRITAPVDYGVSHVAPLVARFCDDHQRVSVELELSDDKLDIVEQRFDVAFRIGWLKDSTNLARKLRGFSELAVCAPDTLKRHPIDQPENLADLPFIRSTALGNATRWTFRQGKKARSVEMQSPLSLNITLAIREALLASSTFTILPDFLVENDLASGRLVTLLPTWELRTGGVFAVSPPSRLRTNAVRTFLSMAQEHSTP